MDGTAPAGAPHRAPHGAGPRQPRHGPPRRGLPRPARCRFCPLAAAAHGTGVRRRPAPRRRRNRYSLPDGWTGPAAEIGNAASRPSAGSFCPDNGPKTPPKSEYVDKNSSLTGGSGVTEDVPSDCPAAGPLRTQADDRRAAAQADHPGPDPGAPALWRGVPLRQLESVRQPRPDRRRARDGGHRRRRRRRHPAARPGRRWRTASSRGTCSTGSPSRPPPRPTRASATESTPSRSRSPATFPATWLSPGSFDSATQAMLNVTTNDANNYLLSTIVDKLTTAVHASVAKEVGAETANQLLTGLRHHPHPDGQGGRRRGPTGRRRHPAPRRYRRPASGHRPARGRRRRSSTTARSNCATAPRSSRPEPAS